MPRPPYKLEYLPLTPRVKQPTWVGEHLERALDTVLLLLAPVALWAAVAVGRVLVILMISPGQLFGQP